MKRCTNRHCTKAGELQPFTSFNKNITTRSGYSCRCKVCLGNATKLSTRLHDNRDFVANQDTIVIALENEIEKLSNIRGMQKELDEETDSGDRLSGYGRIYREHVIATVKTLKALVV